MPFHETHGLVSLDAFQAGVRDVCGNFLVLPPAGGRDMRGRITLNRRHALSVAVVDNSAAEIDRDWRCIRQDSAEHLFLVLQKTGHAVMRQGDAEVRLKPGDFMMIDSAYPSHFVYGDGGSRQYSVHLNRADFAHRFGTCALGGCSIPGASAIGRAMRATIDRILAAEGIAPRQRVVSEAFFDLMGSYLCSLEEGELPSAATSGDLLLARTRAYIKHRFRDPDCTPAAVAEAMGVSLRALQRRFQAEGSSLSECLIRARLDYARQRLLCQDASGGERISTIAFDSGFNDLSYFNRRFRARFQASPGEYRLRTVSPSPKSLTQ
ncbi:helix-turn-helix domain-containing protein [Nitratireductor sp. ZSWI3]|uniref:helix-turn-helix domain-containing protein n=1 Tax=Nitratireductor sp. ZSWI3 TaxID=2966359 RepID=UPI00214FEE1E|nr:helix-turn-helix domain-containing protein [Nitratireductor sp. ZSWI3]MCR4265466.1 helix-turn-helix domain-containing protein [Nitratireductor sp. ZSWI3]